MCAELQGVPPLSGCNLFALHSQAFGFVKEMYAFIIGLYHAGILDTDLSPEVMGCFPVEGRGMRRVRLWALSHVRCHGWPHAPLAGIHTMPSASLPAHTFTRQMMAQPPYDNLYMGAYYIMHYTYAFEYREDGTQGVRGKKGKLGF